MRHLFLVDSLDKQMQNEKELIGLASAGVGDSQSANRTRHAGPGVNRTERPPGVPSTVLKRRNARRSITAYTLGDLSRCRPENTSQRAYPRVGLKSSTTNWYESDSYENCPACPRTLIHKLN